MFLFPVFAVLVWYACYRWRRQYLGYAALAGAVAGVLLLTRLEILIERWLHLELLLLRALLMAEAGIVLAVGAFIVSCARYPAQTPCRKCGYELHGLDDANPTCPECGLAHAARKVRRRPCPCCATEVLVARGQDPRCATCVDHGIAVAA